jgi:hypothetical protein
MAMAGAARQALDQAMGEADWQRTIVDLARTLGWMALHVADSRKEVVDRRTRQRCLVGDRDAAGLPDWLFIRDRVLFVELKRQDGQLSARQREVLNALEEAGAEWFVWRPADYDEAIQVLTERVGAR